jgi:hypothetical protein
MATHTLSTAQLWKLLGAMRGTQDWPRITDDPQVNYAVDCLLAEGDEEPVYNAQLYQDEVAAFVARHDLDDQSKTGD